MLKDASSAAIYGSRAANGVVVITTKTGANQAPTVRMDYAFGMQTTPKRFLPDVMNGEEFATFMKELNEDNVRSQPQAGTTLTDIPVEYRTRPVRQQGHQLARLVTRSAPTHNLNLSVSGGTQNISGLPLRRPAQRARHGQGTDYRRASMRAGVDANPSSKLKLGLNIAPAYEVRNLPVTGGRGAARTAAPRRPRSSRPLLGPYNDDGT